MPQARHIPTEGLMACLDEGGYTRYDFRTADRLQALSEVIGEHYGGQAAVIGQTFITYPELRQALDVLPGWGPVTIELFLRELRGVWPGAQPPLDQRAAAAHPTWASLGPVQPDFPRLARRRPPNATSTPAIWKAGWSGSPWPTTGEWPHARAGTGAAP